MRASTADSVFATSAATFSTVNSWALAVAANPTAITMARAILVFICFLSLWHMPSGPVLAQPKRDVHGRPHINCSSAALRRLESDAFGRVRRGFIQTMSEPADDAQD